MNLRGSSRSVFQALALQWMERHLLTTRLRLQSRLKPKRALQGGAAPSPAQLQLDNPVFVLEDALWLRQALSR